MKFVILPPLQHVPLILLWVEGEEALWPSLLPLAGVQCIHHLRVHLFIELIHSGNYSLYWRQSPYQGVLGQVHQAWQS